MARGLQRLKGAALAGLFLVCMIAIVGCSVGKTVDLSAAAAALNRGALDNEVVYSDIEPDPDGEPSAPQEGEVILAHDEEGKLPGVSHTDLKPDGNEPAEPDKVVALTFDDGPDTRYTPAILDILKEKGVKATFFVVGLQVSKSPEVLERIVKEGHSVGNHTLNHKDLSELNKDAILKEINAGDKLIKDAVGFTPVLFRAPYGAVSDTLKDIIDNTGRQMIGWTVDTRDWAGTPIDEMREMIRTETKPGGIILMHSFGGKHIAGTVEALPAIIDDLKEMGYSFATVDELP